MKLYHRGTDKLVRPGCVLAHVDTGKLATVAGWDPSTSHAHVWTDPFKIGDLRYVKAWSVHSFNLEWRDE